MATTHFSKFFDNLPFRRVVWLLPICWTLHEAEEWNILDWYHRHWVNVPEMTTTDVRTWLVFISLAGFLWTALARIPPSPRLTAFLVLPFFTFFAFANALQHVYFVFEFEACSPGVTTSVLLLIPSVPYVTIRDVRERLIPIWYAAAVYVPVIPAMKLVIETGNVVPDQMHSIYGFSSSLADALGLK